MFYICRFFFFFQAEDGIRDLTVTGVQTCALPISRQGDLVTLVEVKTRRGKAFGSPLEAVTGSKRRELVKAARVWVDRFGKPADIYRFDCIAIMDGKLEHVADAFRPGWR